MPYVNHSHIATKKLKTFTRPILAVSDPFDLSNLHNLAESDVDALEEMAKELDEALGAILEAQEQKEKRVKKKDGSDGETCIKCKNFYPMAEANQKDGTLICYSCRTYG